MRIPRFNLRLCRAYEFVSRSGLLLVGMLVTNIVHADAHFRHITTADGISSDRVFSVIQDRAGYIWLGTENGLDRYDGYHVITFKHDAADPSSLSANQVRGLYEDKSGRLWVGSYGGGLDLYDSKTGSFKHYRHTEDNIGSISSNNIWSLGGTPDGKLIIGTFDAGIDILDPDTGETRHFPPTTGSAGPGDKRINAVFSDAQGRTWLGTQSGLDIFEPHDSSFRHYLSRFGSTDSNVIWGIAEDQNKRLWLATHLGVSMLAQGQDSPTSALPLPSIPASLQGDDLRCIFVDSHDNIWVGGAYSGVYFMPSSGGRALNFHQVLGDSDSLSSNTVWSIFEDRSGIIWIATDNGMDLLDPNTLAIQHIKPLEVNNKLTFASNKVLTLLETGDALLIGSTAGIYRLPILAATPSPSNDTTLLLETDAKKYGAISALSAGREGVIYAGSERGYILVVDRQGHILHAWQPGTDIGLLGRAIVSIIPGDKDTLYLGTLGNGLLLYDTARSTTDRIAAVSAFALRSDDQIADMVRFSPEMLWVATDRGLFQVDIKHKSSVLVRVTHDANEPEIVNLYLGKHGQLFVGTTKGLWKLRLDNTGHVQGIDRYEQSEVLQHDTISEIEPDQDGNLWMSGDDTLISLNPATGKTTLIGRDQGLPITGFYSRAHSHTRDSRLWFGGAQGLLGFNPRTLRPNQHPPDIAFNGLTVYRDGKPLALGAQNNSTATLYYRDSIITFDMTALDFGSPLANTFSYRLVGLQPEWTHPTPNHLITFTNLEPGRYRLEVKAANNWGTWSARNATLELQVLPPWWRTWWAYTLYLLFAIGSSVAYVYSLKRKIVREKQISASLREANAIKTHFVQELETQVSKATQDLRETLQGVNLKNAELEIAQKRAAEGEQIKSQFLANMSHELRTPLTGVLGYTKLLASTPLNSEQKDYIGTIRQSSETLLAIINDTLDLSRLEAGKLLIDEVDFDLLEVIESTLELLAPIAYQKRLELVRVVPSDVPLQLRGDPLRLRQILTNLLSNAIKFTESGSVCLKVAVLEYDERSTTLSFAVQDTGIGIPRNELDKLFHAYARSRISTQHHVEGTGLGLAISKKLVDLMDGEIRVDSKLGQGSTFEFCLKYKTQKHMEPRASLSERVRILLYDSHPLSNDAWRACLERMGAEVKVITDLAEAGSVQADAAVMALTERELSQLQELKAKFTPALPPMLILAPRIERQSLKHLSETLFHRVLSKTAREKTVYLEIQSLVQRAVRAQPEPSAVGQPAAAAPPPEAPLILVADDNRINRRLLVTMLRQAGFRAAEAGNGHELLDLARKEPWHAVLMDIHMPGMDGIEAAGKLHAAMGDKVPPIIAMSADVMPETRRQVLGGLMNDFLVKPFTEQELVAMLHRHLDRHARGRLTPAS